MLSQRCRELKCRRDRGWCRLTFCLAPPKETHPFATTSSLQRTLSWEDKLDASCEYTFAVTLAGSFPLMYSNGAFLLTSGKALMWEEDQAQNSCNTQLWLSNSKNTATCIIKFSFPLQISFRHTSKCFKCVVLGICTGLVKLMHFAVSAGLLWGWIWWHVYMIQYKPCLLAFSWFFQVLRKKKITQTWQLAFKNCSGFGLVAELPQSSGCRRCAWCSVAVVGTRHPWSKNYPGVAEQWGALQGSSQRAPACFDFCLLWVEQSWFYQWKAALSEDNFLVFQVEFDSPVQK